MKIKSTIPDFSTAFCRRLVSWCCRELGLPAREVREAMFRKARNSYGGLCRGHRIGVRVGGAECFPCDGTHFKDLPIEFADSTEALVAVTAHELAHLEQIVRGHELQKKLIGKYGRAPVNIPSNVGRRPLNRGGSEWTTTRMEWTTLKAFRANRETLLADWHRPEPVREKKAASIVDVRATKAAKMLAAWQRKAKLAATKIKKYRKQVCYYEKKIGQAATKGKSCD